MVLEYSTKDKGHGLTSVWPSGSVRPRRPTRRPYVTCRGLTASTRDEEKPAVVGWHREAKNGTLSEDDRDDNLQQQTRATVKPAAGTWSKGAMAQDGEGRDLRGAWPAQLRGRARRFPPNHSGWPMFFALISSFSRETDFTKFVSEAAKYLPWCRLLFFALLNRTSISDPDPVMRPRELGPRTKYLRDKRE